MNRSVLIAASCLVVAAATPLFGAPQPAAQDPQISQWLAGLERTYLDLQLRPGNVLAKYEDYDFTKVLQPRSEFLGYIGTDFQRLYIILTSVTRDPADKRRYLVKGRSGVMTDQDTFEGTITLDSVREYELAPENPYDSFGSDHTKSEGFLVGRFEFAEDRAQAHSGNFKGIVTAYWLVDKHGDLQYGDFGVNSDEYSNNQYVGTWTSYATGKAKVANWGEYRIPFSGDLDRGAGEFSPNPKYNDKGWADYDTSHPDE